MNRHIFTFSVFLLMSMAKGYAEVADTIDYKTDEIEVTASRIKTPLPKAS